MSRKQIPCTLSLVIGVMFPEAADKLSAAFVNAGFQIRPADKSLKLYEVTDNNLVTVAAWNMQVNVDEETKTPHTDASAKIMDIVKKSCVKYYMYTTYANGPAQWNYGNVIAEKPIDMPDVGPYRSIARS